MEFGMFLMKIQQKNIFNLIKKIGINLEKILLKKQYKKEVKIIYHV